MFFFKKREFGVAEPRTRFQQVFFNSFFLDYGCIHVFMQMFFFFGGVTAGIALNHLRCGHQPNKIVKQDEERNTTGGCIHVPFGGSLKHAFLF
jgi:hypothetical protein